MTIKVHLSQERKESLMIPNEKYVEIAIGLSRRQNSEKQYGSLLRPGTRFLTDLLCLHGLVDETSRQISNCNCPNQKFG